MSGTKDTLEGILERLQTLRINKLKELDAEYDGHAAWLGELVDETRQVLQKSK